MTARRLTFRDAINEAIRLEMHRDPTVIVLGEDIAGGASLPHIEGESKEAKGGAVGATRGLRPEFGSSRVLDTPISESGYIGAAVGAAVTGLRPIAELMFVDFFGVCFDQMFNQAAKLRYMSGGKMRVPVVIRAMIGAGFRAGAQHSECLYSIFAHIPGLKVVVPSTPYDAKGLLTAAIRDDDPVIFFEHKLLYHTQGGVPEESYVLPLGKADVKREGNDVTIITLGRMVHLSLSAAEQLSGLGIDTQVIDLRSISPLDETAILEGIKKTHRLLVVDEDNPRCSLATDVVALVASRAFHYMDAPPRMVTAPHSPVPFSPSLEDAYLPCIEDIVSAVKALMR
jgi:pyruvate dehydrogenase E1 component beta subunit